VEDEPAPPRETDTMLMAKVTAELALLKLIASTAADGKPGPEDAATLRTLAEAYNLIATGSIYSP
jgi:hypothetical protein